MTFISQSENYVLSRTGWLCSPVFYEDTPRYRKTENQRKVESTETMPVKVNPTHSTFLLVLHVAS